MEILLISILIIGWLLCVLAVLLKMIEVLIVLWNNLIDIVQYISNGTFDFGDMAESATLVALLGLWFIGLFVLLLLSAIPFAIPAVK